MDISHFAIIHLFLIRFYRHHVIPKIIIEIYPCPARCCVEVCGNKELALFSTEYQYLPGDFVYQQLLLTSCVCCTWRVLTHEKRMCSYFSGHFSLGFFTSSLFFSCFAFVCVNACAVPTYTHNQLFLVKEMSYYSRGPWGWGEKMKKLSFLHLVRVRAARGLWPLADSN